MSEWRVKFDGPCSRCGIVLARGSVAVWNRASRSMHCVECPTAGHRVEAEAPPPIDAGIAGGSARREHGRRVAKREADTRARWGNRIGGLVLKLTDEPQSTRAWRVGAEGEEKLAKALAEVDGLRVLNDRRVPGTRGNIDHIVVAPAGVFVVDAKHYKGLVKVRDRGGLFRTDLRLYVAGRDCSHLAEGLGWQVEAVEQALESADLDPLPPVTPVLCFIGAEWPLFRPPSSFGGVRLESIRSLRGLLADEQALDGAAIDRTLRVLATTLPAK